jgi:N-acylneuraminate cytidylyltransferase
MVVSVGVSKLNPYFNLFEETNDQLIKSKPSNCTRRQDCPPCYFYNGSIYLINSKSLEEKSISEFSKVKKYVMDDKYSLDIDTPLDWAICETVLQTGILKM